LEGETGPLPPAVEPEASQVERLQRENAELRQRVITPREHNPGRSFVSWLLIVLTCLAMVGAVLATWVHNTTLDTKQFVNVVAPLIQDPAIDKAISQEVVQRLFKQYNVKARIERELKKDLPKILQSQAGNAASAAENLSKTLTTQILKSSAFQAVWRRILTTAHSQALRGIRTTGSVNLNQQGEVVLDITTLLSDVKDKLSSMGLGFLKNVKVPSGLGEVVLYKNSQLGNIKTAVNTLDDLFLILPFAAVILLILSVLVATSSRRAVVGVSVGIIIVMTGLAVALKVVQFHYINPISNAANRTAAMALVGHVQGSLNRVDLGLVILSVVTIISAVVAGPYRWAASMHASISVPERKRRKHPEEALPEKPWFFSRFAWPLRVAGLCVAIMLLLYLPWANAATLTIVCAVYAVYLIAIEILR
jgi:hypothetical protein